MGTLQASHCLKRTASYSKSMIAGLTLIEVLIALAIVGIAMTAVIKATTQNIRATHYLQNKTIAMWVAKEVISEIETGILILPDEEPLKKATAMFGKLWYWQASEEVTPNKRIKKIRVKVFENESDDEEVSPLINLESYSYHAKE